jgi:peroxiredoxin
LNDNKGKLRQLTDLEGQVVLLDFHVFGQSESPARILALRELYNKYHAKGFEIYQVSLDGDEHFWKQQTAALPWISVRADENNNSFLTIYNVQTLPEFFLIDRGNNLVSRSQQIEDLDKAIEKLL